MAERILMNELRTLSKEKWVNIEVSFHIPLLLITTTTIIPPV